jgi:hypothetical protein
MPAPRSSTAASESRYACRFGVWRSLVARSVRVGEVPSSNLGTPMREAAACRGFSLSEPVDAWEAIREQLHEQ